MKYQVWYTAPVCAMVDVDEGTVTQVVVVDEMLKRDEKEGVTLEDYSGPAPKPIAEKAIEVAENAEWPAWNFGF